MSKTASCCICGRDLPNRYAIAGDCGDQGCQAAFCQSHWQNGNHQCPQHGWEGETPVIAPLTRPVSEIPAVVQNAEPEATKAKKGWRRWLPGQKQDGEPATEPTTPSTESEMPSPNDQKLARNAPEKVAKQAMSSALSLLKQAGGQAAGLLARLKKDRSPEAMLATFDGQTARNRERREQVSATL